MSRLLVPRRRLLQGLGASAAFPGLVGCGRGEIIRHSMRLGIEAYGIDYAEVAALMTKDVINQERESAGDARAA